jgi:ADP-ribose pyrophosphatase
MTISRLPPLPAIRLELVEDISPGGAGFLTLLRRRLRARYPDGTVSQPFVYDAVDRRALDAVVIVAHYLEQGQRYVYLRSAVRPPLELRQSRKSPVPETGSPCIWELPAGLVEPDEEDSLEGVRRSAQRELAEELGFRVPAQALAPLGPSAFPAPGFVGERHFFFEVTVDPGTREEPSLDGSPLEHFGSVVAVALSDALLACDEGELEDEKTELALRRLAGRYR